MRLKACQLIFNLAYIFCYFKKRIFAVKIAFKKKT